MNTHTHTRTRTQTGAPFMTVPKGKRLRHCCWCCPVAALQYTACEACSVVLVYIRSRYLYVHRIRAQSIRVYFDILGVSIGLVGSGSAENNPVITCQGSCDLERTQSAAHGARPGPRACAVVCTRAHAPPGCAALPRARKNTCARKRNGLRCAKKKKKNTFCTFTGGP